MKFKYHTIHDKNQIHTWTDGNVASYAFNVPALTVASSVLGCGVVTIAQASSPAVPTSEGASAPITPFTPAAMNFPKRRKIDGNLKARLIYLLLYCKVVIIHVFLEHTIVSSKINSELERLKQ